ncbi:MAG TPA: hypothetical protein VGN47_01535 [Blastococcus sp.]|nr:hypothetical protein [Blastococcus sp.]
MDHFPRLRARDLTGRARWLPDAFQEQLGLVFVAFRREQQATIDSWGPWLRRLDVEERLAFYEVPVLGRRWAPMRPVIDGGMAAAVRDETARRRTLTVYGDVGSIAEALGIADRSTVSIFLVDRDGHIMDRATGPFDEAAAARFAAHAKD